MVNESVRTVSGKVLAPTVAVIIPTFNRASYLGDALRSVIGQTHPVDEIIVVDDGSEDHTRAVVAEFPNVTFLHQDNKGPSAARNAGILAATSDYVLCLDSDDVLVPDGIESSLACMAENPGVAFVYGGHHRVDAALQPIDRPYFTPMSRDAYRDLLQNNSVYMLGTVLFDRAKLLEVGGFDSLLRRSEDYDLFLRLARKYPIAGDPAIIANYRIHGSNLSTRMDEMLISALAVQDRNRPDSDDAAGQRAYRRGKKMLTRTYAIGAWRADAQVSRARKWDERLGMARIAPFASVAAAAWQFSRRRLPQPWVERIRRALRGQAPALGRVDLGDLRRRRPVSRSLGYDRGTPVDRYYLERVLASHSSDITGRVLDVGDAGYSSQFGHDISRQDVMQAPPGDHQATIVGDLSQPGTLPEAAFDCVVLMHTLQYIYDLQAAVAEIRRGLKPGGTALVTLPGVAAVDSGEFTQYWSFSGAAAKRLFADVFGAENVQGEEHGNVYAATCFLQGLALEEIDSSWLDPPDPKFPILVTIRARRAD
jgi:glycosyltransferase involved in cell wall biosynthesis/SAM-dependent methyltransferase